MNARTEVQVGDRVWHIASTEAMPKGYIVVMRATDVDAGPILVMDDGDGRHWTVVDDGTVKTSAAKAVAAAIKQTDVYAAEDIYLRRRGRRTALESWLARFNEEES